LANALSSFERSQRNLRHGSERTPDSNHRMTAPNAD
jgi:hypothetical protein